MISKAPAKINLFLEILGRRSDGYHELETVFQEIPLYDILDFRIIPSGIILKSDSKDIPLGPGNIVHKALELVRRDLGVDKGISVNIKKNIPVGGGLGGGSSDGLKAIEAGYRLLSAKKGEADEGLIRRLAGTLGADVSFFIYGGTAFAAGIGDKIRSLKGVRSFWVVLMNPGIHISTKWVYNNLPVALTKRRSIHKIINALTSGSAPKDWAHMLFNRLEDVVLPRVAKIAEARQALSRAGCRAALMSGSGSSVFGVVDSVAIGRKVLSVLRRERWDARLLKASAS